MALQTRAEATPSGTRGVKRNKHLPCPGWSQAGYCRRSFMEKLPTSFKALRYLPFLVASAFFMQMLDATILNTAIPTIARSFNSHPLQLHSLVTAYTLTVCVLIPASGWISDKLGSRRTFLLAISVFSAGSLLCALSTSIPMMTACRVIQGIGGAFLMPVGRLVVLRSYPRSMFVNVLNIVTIPALLGPLLGPVLGGIIAQYASWHWIFLINIPVGMAGLWATRKLMPDLKAVREQKFDWRGFFLFSSSAVLATMGLSSAGGVTDKTRMAILTSAGGILQLLYWALAFRSKAPIFSPALFRIRNFAIGIAGNIVCRLGGSCLPYLMSLFFQVVLGYSALQSGIGALLASFHFVGPGTHELILLGMLALLGGANSIQFTCMNTLTLIDLPNADASSGNSLLSTIMQLSIAVSIAAASLLLDSFGGHSATSGKAVETAFHTTFAAIGAIAAASSFIFALVDKDKGITRKRKKAA